MKQKAPEIYEDFIRWYGPGDLQALSSNEAVFNDFAAQFNAEVEKREKAEQILDNAVNDDLAAAAGAAAEGPEEDAADESAEEAAEEEVADHGVSAQTESMLSDPFTGKIFMRRRRKSKRSVLMRPMSCSTAKPAAICSNRKFGKITISALTAVMTSRWKKRLIRAPAAALASSRSGNQS